MGNSASRSHLSLSQMRVATSQDDSECGPDARHVTDVGEYLVPSSSPVTLARQEKNGTATIWLCSFKDKLSLDRNLADTVLQSVGKGLERWLSG